MYMYMYVCIYIYIWRLQVQSWLQMSNNTGILNTRAWLWLTESEQETPKDLIKDVVWSSEWFPSSTDTWRRPEDISPETLCK